MLSPRSGGNGNIYPPVTSPLLPTKCTECFRGILIWLMCISSLRVPLNTMTLTWQEGENGSKPNQRSPVSTDRKKDHSTYSTVSIRTDQFTHMHTHLDNYTPMSHLVDLLFLLCCPYVCFYTHISIGFILIVLFFWCLIKLRQHLQTVGDKHIWCHGIYSIFNNWNATRAFHGVLAASPLEGKSGADTQCLSCRWETCFFSLYLWTSILFSITISNTVFVSSGDSNSPTSFIFTLESK